MRGTVHSDPRQSVIKRLLLIFAKQPQPGWSKTRLAADVGLGAADVLYRAFLADVASRAYTQDLTGQQHDQLLAAESDGFRQVMIIGADTPHVERTVLLDSFRLLDDNDVVVGRATDGGYYLLGLRSGWDLVAGLDMGSRDVLDDLVVTVPHRGYSVGFAVPAMDIDTAADLHELISRGSLNPASCPATCRAVHELVLGA